VKGVAHVATRSATPITAAAAVLLALILGWQIGSGDQTTGTALALLLPAAMAALWLASRPRLAFAVFLVVLCAVPVWIVEPNLGVAMPPASLAFLLVVPAVVLVTRQPMRLPDWWLVGLVGACATATVVFDSPTYAMGALVAQSATAYLVGRRLAPAAGEVWTYRAMAVATAIVAAWACIEFVSGLHVFENLVGSGSQSFWRTIQVRGGIDRSEAAFGHAIALGGFIAMGIPFVLSANFRTRTQLLLLVVLSGGLVSSLSRGPILGGLLALVLTLVFLPSSQVTRNTRLVVFGVGLFAVFVVAPRLLDFFVSVGAEETAASADYRQRLLSYWATDLNLFGQADFVTVTPTGETLYRGFQSIDNAWLQLGLQFGGVPLVMAAAVVAICMIRVLQRRGRPAEVAVASQAFVLATVAQITQYGPAVWMLGGMAVAFAARGRTSTAPDPTNPSSSSLRRPALDRATAGVHKP
jgi:hypothetical protein